MDANLDLVKIILHSGIVVKTVLLVLIGFSLYSWAIVFYKFKSLKNIENDNKTFMNFFRSNHSLSEINGQIGSCSDSTYAIIFKDGYEEIQKISDKAKNSEIGSLKNYFSEHGTESVIRALKKGVNKSNEIMDHKLSPLASISSVAPFVGLFGTVWGIIDSFRGLSAGGGTIEAVAPGIAEALVATAVGLLAAIPANWFFNIFSNKINKINSELDSFENDFINLVERIVYTQGK